MKDEKEERIRREKKEYKVKKEKEQREVYEDLPAHILHKLQR